MLIVADSLAELPVRHHGTRFVEKHYAHIVGTTVKVLCEQFGCNESKSAESIHLVEARVLPCSLSIDFCQHSPASGSGWYGCVIEHDAVVSDAYAMHGV